MPAVFNAIEQIVTHKAPANKPQPIAFVGETMWVGCLETSQLIAIDPKTWSVLETVSLPGKPYGLALLDGALRIVISIGEDDDRYIYRFTPGQALTEDGRIACPDLTGSYLASNCKSLHLVQQSNQRMLILDQAGAIEREIALPTRCAGFCFANGTWFMTSADDEFDVLELTTLNIDSASATLSTIAPMHLEARGLAFDGRAWWTSYRELHEIVSFTITHEAAN